MLEQTITQLRQLKLTGMADALLSQIEQPGTYEGLSFELPVPNCPYGLCGRKATLHDERQIAEVRSCVNVEVAVLASPSLIVLKTLQSRCLQVLPVHTKSISNDHHPLHPTPSSVVEVIVSKLIAC